MISEPRISHLGVIAEAEVELSTGFTVVTGETGAGKTMFVSALSLLMGRKVGSGVVRKGAEKAEVEGIFSSVRLRALPHRRGRRQRRRRSDHLPHRGPEGPSPAPPPEDAPSPSPCSPRSPTSSSPCTDSPNSCDSKAPPSSGSSSTQPAAPNSKQWPRNTTQHLRTGARPRPDGIKDSTAARRERILWLNGCLEAIDKVRPVPGEDEARPRRPRTRCRRRDHAGRRQRP